MDFSTTNGRFSGASQTVRPLFQGSAGAMFPVVLKGLFLTIVTLGVYRFWYVTDVRRFLWTSTQVDGDLVEYTGRGVELFIGFLIALAVLIPLYGAVFLVTTQLDPILGSVLQSVVTFGLIFLAQYALFRARRYRLTRTIWRGIRFQQSGSGWAYAAKSFGWAVVATLTLGLAYPFMRASLERYKMTNTWYGDQKGAFSATGGQLFRRGILLWLIAALTLAAPVVLLAVRAFAGGVEEFAEGVSLLQAAPLLGVALLILFVPLYLAIEFRWWANGCSIGPASARCDLGLFAFLKVYLGYVGIVVLFALALAAVGGLVFHLLGGAGFFETEEPGPAQIAFIVISAMLYFVIALIFAALWQLFGVRPIWRKSFESVEIAGLGALMAAQSLESEANAFGEGVADALDFGGF